MPPPRPQQQPDISRIGSNDTGNFLQPLYASHGGLAGEGIICNAVFGPSSNFSLLPNLFHRLLPFSRHASATNCIDIFGYRPLIFPSAQDDLVSGMSLNLPLNLALLTFNVAKLHRARSMGRKILPTSSIAGQCDIQVFIQCPSNPSHCLRDTSLPTPFVSVHLANCY